MGATEQEPSAVGSNSETSRTLVTAHRSTPERFVFTEQDNVDAWIATDFTVEPER